MNSNIKLLLKNNFNYFLRLVELGIIDINIACNDVIEYKEPDYILEFARRFGNNSNIRDLEDAIISTYNAQYIYAFACNVESADILKLEDALINVFLYTVCCHNDFEILCAFADITGADISKLEDAVIKKNKALYIFDLAKKVKGANILKLENAIIATGDLLYIFVFARDIDGANIPKLEDAIIKYDVMDGAYIERFIDEVSGANIEKLKESLKVLNEKNKIAYINSKFKDSPNLIKLLKLLENEETDVILESRTTYTKLFQEDVGATRKLTKSQKS